MHHFVERRFHVDDAVGAIAVHGYAGFAGLVIAGFMLWGHPSSPFEGYAAINPLGQLIGAVIMFGVLGFVPTYILCAILKAMGQLRIPYEVELVGLDLAHYRDRYLDEEEVHAAEIKDARQRGLIQDPTSTVPPTTPHAAPGE
jgi:ammonia channel protein AmtB